MIDQDVRDMLRERASTIAPAPDGFERIQAKLDGSATVVTSERRRRPVPMLAAAAAVVVVALLGAVLVAQRDEPAPVVTTPGPEGEVLDAVWPSNDPEVLRSISASWAADESPILAAQQYLRDRLGVEVDGADISTVPDGDVVSVGTPHSIVTLRRLDGDGPWYVTMSSSPNVAGLDLQHRGDSVVFSAFTGTAGDLRVEVRAPGSEDASSSTIDAVERDTVSTVVDISGSALTDEPVAVAAILTTETGEVFLSEAALGAPAADAPTPADVPLGVWPWPGDAVEDSVFADPGDTARAYVATRVLEVGATTESDRSERDGGIAITFGGDVSTTVHLREADGRWYVERSESDLVTLHDAGDGTVTARVETGGSLTHTSAMSGASDASTETVDVQGGEEYPGLGYTLGRDDVAVRELFVLDTTDGTTGITETSFRAGAPPIEPDAPISPEEQLGVWPTLGDDIDAATLSDPLRTAERYLAAAAGGVTDRTQVSDFRRGDNTSGEVEVSGDITATLVLRSVDSRWHVETVWSPLVEAAELAPGEVSLTAAEDGVLTVTVLDSYGAVVQSMPATVVSAGEERLVVPDAPDGTPLTVRWTLQTPATTALGDVRLYGGAMSEPPVETTMPADAIWDVAGLDARELTSQYLGDRLGGRTVTTNEAVITGDTAEVTWEAGVVRLVQRDEYWFVVEAIGDSIQIESPTTLRLAQAGTVHLTRGSQTLDVRNDVDREGTIVEFDLPGDSDVLRAVFETDTGFVSLAERRL